MKLLTFDLLYNYLSLNRNIGMLKIDTHVAADLKTLPYYVCIVNKKNETGSHRKADTFERVCFLSLKIQVFKFIGE